MKKKGGCPELEKEEIWRLVNIDRNLPQKTVEHASVCEECRFWLSYFLAINKAAFYSTLIKEKEDCPGKEHFIFLLRLSAYSIRISGKPLLEGAPQDIVHTFELDDLAYLTAIWNHINSCAMCRIYYDGAGRAMCAAQEKYAKDILQKKTIRPVAVDMASEGTFSWDKFKVPKGKKPN